MAIYLSHEDVKGLIRMGDILQAVEQAFKDYGLGDRLPTCLGSVWVCPRESTA